ncbi:nitrogen fixation protein NifB [Mobilisporobacter senegalensis]|uniref:FeMo cofactor biosynthesis protein NifB n=1 Tax=Mobilisporobacter senegalensis TaxID=1329262 RepID=A0A3N1XSR5_9FIRM|nr:radical SAM protein [Mobilisporobacter senegalensis]ROR28212.1 nitrogen fixation protein NifB [Mobilisporobacter senegalensis]
MNSTFVEQEKERLEYISNRHPCFGGGPNMNKGRVHLPVSPTCNIQCAFCKRSMNKLEQRPGVTNKLLEPAKAADIVDKALELCPEITVAGIAGPGDTLATHLAIDTFEIINQRHPELINCLSTNGLLLERYAEELISVGVETITVTVNATDPEILKEICLYVIYEGKKYEGITGSRILIEAQKRGIRKAAELGALIKINIVLIPGVNDGHIEEIARTVKELGAAFINIIPLIPQHIFADKCMPTCEELHKAREIAEQYLPVFRHCKKCRADACGIPGKKDVADLLYDYREVEQTFSHG